MNLLAPNGKPSNLTQEQWFLVRTPEFKQWFGDWEKLELTKINDSGIDEITLKRLEDAVSKVVDENGEPLVVYHGSNNEFNKFSLEYSATNTGNSGFLGRGFYFSTNKRDAKNYGQIIKPYFLKSLKKLDLRNIEYKELAFLLPNLKMKNGKTWKEAFIEIDNIKSQIKSIEIEDLKNGFFNVHYEHNGNWGMIPKRTIHQIEADKGLGVIIDRLIEEDPNNIGTIGNYFNPIILSQEIKTQGFDVIMSNGTNIFDLGDEIVVFYPEQIKLADGINTTFDSNNPDVRFETGGEITNNDVLKNFTNQVEAYQSNHYGTFNRDNLVESYHKLPDSIKEKIKPITTKNLFRGSDGISYKSAISFTKNEDYAKMFGVYVFPFQVVKDNKGLIDTKRLSALLSKMRITNEIGDDEGEVIVIEPIFSKDIIEKIEKFRFETGGEIRLTVNKIENQQVSRFLSRNTQHNGQFIAKNGKLFYITFDLRQNTCKVYNAELFVEAFKNGYFTGNEEVAIAVFSVDYENKTFSGYSENQSIQVKEEYRRIGIATAITDFVEDVLKMKYKPSKLLSKEMQGFVQNRFENGRELYNEILKEINEVNALSNQELTPMQLQYLNKKLLFFTSEKMNTLSEINENLWQDLIRKQRKVEGILNEKETKKGVAGYLDEKYVYHFTTIFNLIDIIESKSIGNWQELGHIISLTTNPIFGEVEVSGVKSWNQGMNIKNAQFFSDLSVKIVFDLQKIKADGIKITKGSGKTGTHFGEYELIIPKFNEKDKWWKYVSWIEIDNNKKEIKELLDYKWVKEKNIKDVMQLPIDIWIKNKQAESTLGVELKKLGIKVREREKIDVEKYLFGDKKPKYADGGRTIAQTPAPKKEQIYESDINKKESSSSLENAKAIKFDEKTLHTITEKVKEHNKQHKNKKITLASAKAVVRRGMGAYSKSHRPTITGNKPNSRVAWGIARLNAFIYKIINGKSKSGKYKQDDDLIKELGIMVKNYGQGGDIPKANKMFHLPIELTVYVPSTKDVDKVITKREMNERVNEVKEYLGRTFGGFSASDVQGGFVASDGELVNEDIIKVVSFAQKDDYEKHKEQLVNKITEWAEKWGQEAIGLEYEGDLYYVPEKLKKGGSVSNNELKKESYWEGWGFSDSIKVLMKGEHKNLISAFKDIKIAFPQNDKEMIGNETIELFVDEKDLKRAKKIANANKLTLMYADGGEIDYSQGWNQDYENDPLVKAKRKVKETAIRAGMAYATSGASEVARAEGQAMQQAMSSMQNQQSPKGQSTTQSAFPEHEINPQLAQQMVAQNPQLIQMLTKSGGGFQGMARGGKLESEIDYALGGKKHNSDVNKAFEHLSDNNVSLKEMFNKGGVTPKQQNKIARVMREFKEGKLHSGSKQGPVVKDREQAIAIALSEAGASKKMATGGGVDNLKLKNLVGKNFQIEYGSTGKKTKWEKEELVDYLKSVLYHNLFDSGFFYSEFIDNQKEYNQKFKETLNIMFEDVDKVLNDYFVFKTTPYSTKEEILVFKNKKSTNREFIDNWFKTNKNISNELRNEYKIYRENYSGITPYALGGGVEENNKRNEEEERFEIEDDLYQEWADENLYKGGFDKAIKIAKEKYPNYKFSQNDNYSDEDEIEELFAKYLLDNFGIGVDIMSDGKKRFYSNDYFADGGGIENNIQSTEELIKLVSNAREKKIKEWRKFEKVVIGRNDGYSWEDGSTNDNREIATKPSRAKVIEIIKNNPNVTEIHFYGTIKAGEKVGEYLEIVDDFDVLLWGKEDNLFKKGLTFEFTRDDGKYLNTIVDKNETETYKNRKDNNDYIYYKYVDKKYNTTSEGRYKKEFLKEEFENGEAIVVKR